MKDGAEVRASYIYALLMFMSLAAGVDERLLESSLLIAMECLLCLQKLLIV